MKRHPAWLAAVLVLFTLLACNFSRNRNGNSNTNSNANESNRPANAEIFTEEVYTAKSSSGSASSTFSPTDHTIYVILRLNKAKAGTDIKVAWIAHDVEGANNKQLKVIDYTTKAFEEKIPGYLTWPQNWPKGRYRIEVFIDGQLDRTVYYDIE